MSEKIFDWRGVAGKICPERLKTSLDCWMSLNATIEKLDKQSDWYADQNLLHASAIKKAYAITLEKTANTLIDEVVGKLDELIPDEK